MTRHKKRLGLLLTCDRLILRDKKNCTVRFGNCFLRIPLMYHPCCLLLCCQGKLGELTKLKSLKILLYSSFCVLVLIWDRLIAKRVKCEFHLPCRRRTAAVPMTGAELVCCTRRRCWGRSWRCRSGRRWPPCSASGKGQFNRHLFEISRSAYMYIYHNRFSYKRSLVYSSCP